MLIYFFFYQSRIILMVLYTMEHIKKYDFLWNNIEFYITFSSVLISEIYDFMSDS